MVAKKEFPTRKLESCLTNGCQVLFPKRVAGHEFPTPPAADPDGSVPDNDTVRLGLSPVSGNGD